MSCLVAGINNLAIDVLVEESTLVQANGKSYASLKVKYEDRSYNCKRWNYNSDVPDKGSVIKIYGRTDSYQGTISIIISAWEPSDRSPLDFVKVAPIDRNKGYSDLLDAIDNIVSESKRNFILTILEENREAILEAPAAVSMHHDYVGGYLQHTLEVLTNARSLCTTPLMYNCSSYDISLVIMGAILHDIGKLKAYAIESGLPVMTLEGQLYDHIVLGAMMLEDYRKKCDLSEEDMTWFRKLVHIVLSHHVELEYGSPVKPAFPEAFIVSQADMISAKLNRMDTEMAEMTESFQSKKSFMFGTRLYNSDVE